MPPLLAQFARDAPEGALGLVLVSVESCHHFVTIFEFAFEFLI